MKLGTVLKEISDEASEELTGLSEHVRNVVFRHRQEQLTINIDSRYCREWSM